MGNQLYKWLARAYTNEAHDHDFKTEEIEACPGDEEERINSDAECYIVSTLAVAATGM